MNEVEVFNFETNEVRTVVIDEEVWLVAKDVAKTLGYSRTADAIKAHVDEEDKGVGKIQTPGGMQQMTVINQSGVISLSLSSKLPSARKFKRWVTSEVIPSVLKHGAYLTDQKIEEVLTNPDTIIRLATELKEERQAKLVVKQQNSVLLQQNNELKPKADYTDLILSNKTLVTITFIAKDYGMSGLAMNKLLHDLGVQYNQSGVWLLYAKHQTKGWTQSETTEVVKKDGTKKLVMNTKWTQKGRLGLYELLKDNGYLPLIEQDQPA
ncbi:phage antirepressor KilAC domain-containing protein [Leuconostoc mesenteroides]|uniref:phage antirepressor n=1 Tax=Leuconostoc mesenteroides TaxID=1245 RepID=UPI001CBD662D|nr:phage antirepressor KilAC domain-containing protein [Leuconostoc mesenteroides]MBZ1505997.1 phage antirepressor KilAC domain-containing protein [Leuconostoc mesenteroides]